MKKGVWFHLLTWCYFPSEEQGGKYGPKTQGLSQSSQCQADFTHDVPQRGERCEIAACKYTHQPTGVTLYLAKMHLKK